MRATQAATLGAGLAAASCLVAARLPTRARPTVAALLTVGVATGSYVAPALRSDDSHRRRREVGTAAAFSAAAILAARTAPQALGPLLAAHGIYDLHVERTDPEVLPTSWYAPFCATYDVAMGAALIWLLALDEPV